MHYCHYFFLRCLFICSWILLYHGVSSVGADIVPVFATKGDSVTLHTDVETNDQEKILWFFNGIRIAQITGDLRKICTDVQCNAGTEKFRGRLKLDHQTGSLTIRDITNTDSGLYQLKILSISSDNGKIFNVSLDDIFAAKRGEMKRANSVKEGEPVTFDPGVTKNLNYLITWHFNDILIAEITGDQSKICTDEQCDERFRDRLKVNQSSGSLTITNTRTTDSGLYKLQITSSSICRRYSITSVKNFTVISVPDSGLSSAALAGICAAVAVGVLMLLVVAIALYLLFHQVGRKDTRTQHNDQANGVYDLPSNQSGIPLMDDAVERSSNHTDAQVKNPTNGTSSNHIETEPEAASEI